MRKWWYIALSFLMLAPVYWQPRVQAGVLSSHIYNAWLAQLIEAGRTQGLVIVSQTTNILFDLMLGGQPLICPTALCFAGPDVLYACQGSARHAPEEWQREQYWVRTG